MDMSNFCADRRLASLALELLLALQRFCPMPFSWFAPVSRELACACLI